MEKEFGKLPEDRFKRLIQKLPEIRGADRKIRELLRGASRQKLQELLGDGEC